MTQNQRAGVAVSGAFPFHGEKLLRVRLETYTLLASKRIPDPRYKQAVSDIEQQRPRDFPS